MTLFLVVVVLKSAAQELNCKFTVNYSQIQGTSTQVFTTLENALMEFINTRRWTQAQYEMNERIRCSMNLTVKEYNEADGRWKCELIVQSTRPVWQSGYQTVVFSFKDTDVAFNYREFDPLELRDNVIDSNLTAVIAYYAYMIIGLDMDTMAPQGGTEFFRAAEDIVTAAQNLGETGWKAFDSSRNRYALVSDYLEDGMTPLRKLMYGYHRTGMDELSVNAARARATITSMLSGLKEAQQNKPMSALPGLFTEIKKDEFTEFALVQNQKDMQKILNKFYEINESLKEKAFGKKAEEIFKCIPMKMEQFYDRFDKECMEIPIFRYYEPRNVLQRLMYSSNEDLVTIKDKMIKRAELYSELLLEEKDNLIKLREVIREYIKDKTASIKIVMLEEFAKSLDYILEKYDQNLTKNEK